jgi:endonuclease G
MPRKKSSGSAKLPRSFRRTKAFLYANVFVALVLGAWFLFQPRERQDEVARLTHNAFDSRKDITAFDVAWDVWQLYYSKDYVAGVAAGDKTHVYGGVPRVVAPPATSVRVLPNTGYVAGYSDALGNPLWAAYRVADIELKDAPPRPDNFTPDLRTVARIDSQVYTGSDYDRGHMAPNYAIATRYGLRAQEETFQMSNICPQRHTLNAGVWKNLEQRIATNYAGRFAEVWVLAGPVFGTNPEKLRRRVAIPEAFYMIVVDESDGRVRAEAFLFPQETPAAARMDDYIASIDEIERRTGLDFLSELPDAAENALEARKVARVW